MTTKDQARRMAEEVELPEPDGYVAMSPNGSIIVPPRDFAKHNAYAVFTAGQVREAIAAALVKLDEDRRQQDRWDAVPQDFRDWWNGDYDDSTNPFRLNSSAYWAWAGWQAALVKLTQGQEPSLYMGVRLVPYESRFFGTKGMAEKLGYEVERVYYTHPIPSQQEKRKPLTNAQRRQIIMICSGSYIRIGDVIDEVEAAHNIKEQK